MSERRHTIPAGLLSESDLDGWFGPAARSSDFERAQRHYARQHCHPDNLLDSAVLARRFAELRVEVTEACASLCDRVAAEAGYPPPVRALVRSMAAQMRTLAPPPVEAVDRSRELKLLVARVGGTAKWTEHDLHRADRIQLRWTNNGHMTEVVAVEDT